MTQSKLICLILLYMFLCGICSTEGWTSNSIDNYSPADQVFAPLELGSYKATLRKNGYDVNDVNDIIQATTNTKPLVRIKARTLLAHKIGSEAIPVIKPGLDESHPYQRISTARLLGILGDKSGLERLRKDLAELRKDDQEIDKNGTDSQKTQKERISMWSRKFYELDAARVLAEFGDTSVFDLAAEAALKSKSSMRRIQGISTLAELGRIDKATLQAKGCDPEPIFLAIAESETNEFVLTSLKNCVQTTMKPEPVVRILEKLKDSPYLSEKERRLTERGIKRLKKRIEEEKKQREGVENQEQNKTEENLYGPSPVRRAFSSDQIYHLENSLRRLSYNINDVNDIRRATMDEQATTRYKAMQLLTYRIGPEAIPELKRGLESPDQTERSIAAALLARFGDKSGLERLRKDIAEFTKDDKETNKNGTDSQTTKKPHWRFFEAIQTASVLAEFGDTSVFKLVAQAAIEDKYPLTRSIAISALAKLDRIDKATLQANGCDPESVLIAVTKQEKVQLVLEDLSLSIMRKMRPESAVRILEKLKDSPYLSEKLRRTTEFRIKLVKRRIEEEKEQREKPEKENP